METIKYKFKYKSGSTYNIKISLIESFKDFGYFDVLDDPLSSVAIPPFYTGNHVVTGASKNMLQSLRTYSLSTDLSKRYTTSTIPTTNGLNVSLSNSGSTSQEYVYYIDGITYTTLISGITESTIFNYTTVGDNNIVNFLYLPIIKDERKLNQIVSPVVNSEIFIERQIKSVFENNFRISDIGNITQLSNYGGGYFNIIKNS